MNTHVASGFTCLLAHGDGEGQCHKCLNCGEYVRPSQMQEPCPWLVPHPQVESDLVVIKRMKR